ncbi:MAG: 1-acyl-sn-glycerol-3-phosphate acyltransferase [Peptococcaceae bacterium]|nr:1-acyl-sn-glycerol-3-phosphate acyltransferase [Peptococcaceae bacterium]
MVGQFERFDMTRRPNRQWPILTPITWLLSLPKAYTHRSRINKTAMPKHLKPPYFLLCNHNSFMDFMIVTKAIFPHRANYVVAIDGYIGMEWLLRAVGGICCRKFAKSAGLVKNMLHARDNGDIVVLFPEARYSLCGTTAILPASLGKMVQKMNIPVVTLMMHGHHINSPFWNVGSRKVKPVEAEMALLFTQEQTQQLSLDEINARLAEAFVYDDFSWQKEKQIYVKDKKRAEGLHKVLYQCPACNTEYNMTSRETTLSCNHCGKTWEMNELGELRAQKGITEFTHIPDWYEWERKNVSREVKNGTYSFHAKVRIESLPNAKGFVKFSEFGHLSQTMDGFTLTGVLNENPFTVVWKAMSLYSCHIEYDYKGRGDCVDLNTANDTFYLFPEGQDFAVTKIALATEELYHHYWSLQGPEQGQPLMTTPPPVPA